MGLKIDTEKVLKWNNDTNRMDVTVEVTVSIVTNQGTVLFEEGPMYCKTGQDVYLASELLKERLLKRATK